MPNVGLTKNIRPSVTSYGGNGVFEAVTGEVVKLEKTGAEYIGYTVPAGETWRVRYTMVVDVV